MSIVLIGATGQLGQDLASVLRKKDLYAPSKEDLDITNNNQIKAYLENANPQAVINTAAFHNVLNCEHNPERAFRVNALGPRNIARVCNELGAIFYHISTDYVFDGKLGRPYREGDLPSPLMVYGASKLEGERLVASNCPYSYIVRTSGLFGKNPCRAKPDGRNFLDAVIHKARNGEEVKVVGDITCCPTYTLDLARQIAKMIDSNIPPGIYHAVTPSGLSWIDLARLVFFKAGIDVNPIEVLSEDLQAPFSRPPDSRLENAALIAQDILVMKELGEALQEYLDEISDSLK